MAIDPNLTPAHIRRRELRCFLCGRTESHSADQLRLMARTRWPECCGEPMPLAVSEPDPVAIPVAEPVPERRAARRRLARSGVRAELRRGILGMGPNLAVGLVELSETGARLRLKTTVQAGEEVEVALWPPVGLRSLRGPATVRWGRPARDGTYLVGVRFRRRLAASDMAHLAEKD